MPVVMKTPVKLRKFGIREKSVHEQPDALQVLNWVLRDSQQSLELVWDVVTLLTCPGLIITWADAHSFPRVKMVTQGHSFLLRNAPAKTVNLGEIFPSVQHFKVNYSDRIRIGINEEEDKEMAAFQSMLKEYLSRKSIAAFRTSLLTGSRETFVTRTSD